MFILVSLYSSTEFKGKPWRCWHQVEAKLVNLSYKNLKSEFTARSMSRTSVTWLQFTLHSVRKTATSMFLIKHYCTSTTFIKGTKFTKMQTLTSDKKQPNDSIHNLRVHVVPLKHRKQYIHLIKCYILETEVHRKNSGDVNCIRPTERLLLSLTEPN